MTISSANWTYFCKYVNLGNMDVGQVITLNGVWPEIITRVALYKEAVESGDRSWLCGEAHSLGHVVEWLKESLSYPKAGDSRWQSSEYREVFVAPENIREEEGLSPNQKALRDKSVALLGREEAEKTFPELFRSGVIRVRQVSEKIVEEAIEKAKHMDLAIGVKNLFHPDAHVYRVLDNMRKFAAVMIDASRMEGEMTIDAAKKGNKVVVPMANDLATLRYGSRVDVRKDNPVGVKVDFDNKSTIVTLNPQKTTEWFDNNDICHRNLFDYGDKLRSVALQQVTRLDEELYSKIQEIPAVIADSAKILCKKYPAIAALVELLSQLHVTVSNLDNRKLAELEEKERKGKISSEVLESFKAQKELNRREAISAIAKELRCFAKSNRVEGYKLALIAIGVCIAHLDEKNAGKAEDEQSTHLSNFAFTVLKEEFLLLERRAAKEHPEIFSGANPGEIFEEASVRLHLCHFNDGDVVEFKRGMAVSGLARALRLDAIPDGVYTIREKEGKKYACLNIEEKLRSSIPINLVGELCLVTEGVRVENEEEGEAYGNKLKQMVDSAEVVSLPKIVPGRKFAIVADDTVIGSFRNIELKKGAKEANAAADFFTQKQGRVKYSRVLVYTGKDGNTYSALFVILENVGRIDAQKAKEYAAGNFATLEAPKAAKKEGGGKRINKFAAMIQPRQ